MNHHVKYFIIRDFSSTCSSFICRNAEGYMLTCRNA